MLLVLLSASCATGNECINRMFAVVSNSARLAQQCESSQFATEVKTCGGINICDAISQGKQSLSLSTSGDLSISSGNSITLPDASSENELQQLSIAGGTVTLSNNGGSVQLPDASSTNELQSLSLDNGTLSLSSSNSVSLPLPWAVSYRTTSALQFQTTPQFTAPLSTDFAIPVTVTKTTNAFLLTTNLGFRSSQSLTSITFKFVVRKGAVNYVRNYPFWNVEASWTGYNIHGSLVVTGLDPGNDYNFEVWGATSASATLTLLSGSDYTFTVTKLAD